MEPSHLLFLRGLLEKGARFPEPLPWWSPCGGPVDAPFEAPSFGQGFRELGEGRKKTVGMGQANSHFVTKVPGPHSPIIGFCSHS